MIFENNLSGLQAGDRMDFYTTLITYINESESNSKIH